MAQHVPDLLHRAKVWTALAELFVARELQDYDYRGIASTLSASPLDADELLVILRNEVAPTFMANLSGLNPAPEMEGWSEDETRDKVMATLDDSRKRVVSRLLNSLRRDPLDHPVLRPRWQALRPLLNK